MDPDQWFTILLFFLASIYAVAEAASQLIQKHKLQIIVDGLRDKSWFNRKLLPATAGTLRARLNLGKLVTFIPASVFLALDHVDRQGLMVVFLICAFAAIYYLPVVVASMSPKTLLKILLPITKFFAPLIHLLTLPRDISFYGYRNKIRQAASNGEENEREEAEQLNAYIGEAEEEGLFEPDEAQMVRQVVEFSDTLVKEIMTPRVNIECVDKRMKTSEFVPFAAEQSYSRYPVIDQKIDNVVGMIHIKSLLGVDIENIANSTIEPYMMPPFFVPESKKVSLLLRELQESKQQLAIVVDEYGGTAGIITLEDILEEIVGEIEDEHDVDEEEEIIKNADGSLSVSGNVDVSEIEKIFDVELDDSSYETVSGLALNHLKHIPEAGEIFTTDTGIQVEIIEADEKSISKLRLERLKDNE